MAHSDARVVIVGAGPAGAALALLLSRTGARVTLLEREPDFERSFRGEALMPTGLDALAQMGLRDELERLPWRRLESWEIHLDGREIMHVPEPTAAPGALGFRVVAQPALLRLLLSRAEATGNLSLRTGVSVRDLVESGGRVRGVRAPGAAGDVELDADLVVGADGRNSTVRHRAGLELERLPEEYDILWFKLPLPDSVKGRCPIQIFASGPDVALAYVSWDERYQVAWMLPKGGWREARERDWLAECCALFPQDLRRHALARRDEMEGPVPLDVVVGRCPRWSRPGLLVLGDAAHPMSPVRAQGLNMALRDAVVAANHLVAVLRRGDDLDAALAAIQHEREPEVHRIQSLQLREVRGQRWARQRPWLIKPLLRLAPLFTQRPWFHDLWLRQQKELRYGVADVRLNV